MDAHLIVSKLQQKVVLRHRNTYNLHKTGLFWGKKLPDVTQIWKEENTEPEFHAAVNGYTFT